MRRLHIWVGAVIAVALAGMPALGAFHVWDIVEAYSNSDGSVQFIELFDSNSGENQLAGLTLKSNAHTFTFPTMHGIPTGTTNHNMLFATPGFAALPGAVTPNFTIVANFFNPAGDTLNFANVDTKTFTNAPTDGKQSFHWVFGTGVGPTTATNSPTNFAMASGAVNPGDYNRNGTVDAADYTNWRDTLGAAVTQGSGADGNVDSTINAADFTVWNSRFGVAVPGAGSGGVAPSEAVPEPVSANLALAGMLAVGTFGGLAWKTRRRT